MGLINFMEKRTPCRHEKPNMNAPFVNTFWFILQNNFSLICLEASTSHNPISNITFLLYFYKMLSLNMAE
jgi:hypothetical protein